MTISKDVTNFTHFNREKKSVKLRGMFLHFSLKAYTVNIVFNLKRIGEQFINISLYDAQKIRSTSNLKLNLPHVYKYLGFGGKLISNNAQNVFLQLSSLPELATV